MAFALILSKADMELVFWCLSHAGQTTQDANRTQALLSGGLDKWSTASRVPSTHPYYESDPDQILLAINAGGLTLAQFRSRTLTFARQYPWASQLESLANEHWTDVRYAVEPWPYPGDPWAGLSHDEPPVATTTTTTTTTTAPPPAPPQQTTTTPRP